MPKLQEGPGRAPISPRGEELSIYSERLEFYSRLLVKEILESVMQYGLVDEQHFYICFNMNCGGLIVPDTLRNSYRNDNNIVILLRNGEYENLRPDSGDSGFYVDLICHNDQKEHVYVTYSSIVSFVDPSQNFSLEFNPIHEPQSLKLTTDRMVTPNYRDNLLLFPLVG